MAGIINKIGDALHIGGNKEEQKHGEPHKTEVHHGEAAHKPEGEHKEGFLDKFKDKIPGQGGHKEGEHKEGGEKKKEKKKKEHGHEHKHDDSSSSDSD